MLAVLSCAARPILQGWSGDMPVACATSACYAACFD